MALKSLSEVRSKLWSLSHLVSCLQALFNLGFMHEFGAGVAADLDLAKRNYDQARVVMPGADVPVQAALFSLGLHRK